MEAILKQFQSRMTTLHSNPSRFKAIGFTKYFGGIAICYWDHQRKEYCIEVIANAKQYELALSKERGSKRKEGDEDDV